MHPRSTSTPEWDHQVQFYRTDDYLFDAVGGFLADGIRLGEPVVILSTPDHRDGFRRRLEADGVTWDEARRSRRLRWVDAQMALEAIMIGRAPDPDRFHRHVASLVRRAAGPSAPRVRVYGELVDLLWREGNSDAALRLEELWNELGASGDFSLLCAYSRGNIYRESRERLMRDVCDRHARVLPEEVPAGDVDPDEDD